METHRSVVEGAVTAMLPRTNLQKAAVSEAIGEAAGLLEDDESIVRLYGAALCQAECVVLVWFSSLTEL